MNTRMYLLLKGVRVITTFRALGPGPTNFVQVNLTKSAVCTSLRLRTSCFGPIIHQAVKWLSTPFLSFFDMRLQPVISRQLLVLSRAEHFISLF